MKKEKERVTVFKESVLKILYEYQKGTRRPRQQKNSFTAAISEIEMLPQAPDQNWIPAGKDKPNSGELVYLTVHNEVIRGFYDKSVNRYKKHLWTYLGGCDRMVQKAESLQIIRR